MAQLSLSPVTVIAIKPFSLDGREYQVGKILQVTPDEAERLLKSGDVERLQLLDPKTSGEQIPNRRGW